MMVVMVMVHLVVVVMVAVVPEHPVVNQLMVRVKSVEHPKTKRL